MRQHSIPSIFIFVEVSTYTTLFKTLVVNTQGIWILFSAERNRNLFQIRLLPFLVYQNLNEKGLVHLSEYTRPIFKTNAGQRTKCQKDHSIQCRGPTCDGAQGSPRSSCSRDGTKTAPPRRRPR